MSLPGGHKRCALLQVQKAHDWSELLCRVHKRGYHGLVAIGTCSQANGAKCHVFRQAAEPQAEREARSILCSIVAIQYTVSLSLACSEGCDVCHNSIGSNSGAAFICTCALY